MKIVKGGRRVLTGTIDTGSYQGSENRIQLFDGKFTTGYRVVSFMICADQPLTAQEFMAKLTTEPDSTISEVQFSDVRQISFAQCAVETNFVFNYFSWIRDDNMIIEDLYLSAYTTGSSPNPLNYEIVLEKYEFPAWAGAGYLVENLSQAGPQ